jgi:NAD(P)-dependent dehydrogenase (short-subunit alcohol dehydrogenase family)
MNTGLAGKSALITGGLSGIGLGIAHALAEEGVRLALAGLDPDPAAARQLEDTGAAVLPITADLRREADVVRMVQTAIEGLNGLDFYINNAAWTWHQPITRLDAESWHNTLNTNLTAAALAAREASRHMIARGSGGIVIIGSTSRFNPGYREAAYRVSKFGLYALMESLAVELAPFGIRVNLVTPGHYQTRMTSTVPPEAERELLKLIPLRRFGQPLEIGRAVAFLLSDTLSPYTTGAEIVVDGGLHLRPLPNLSAEEARALNQ